MDVEVQLSLSVGPVTGSTSVVSVLFCLAKKISVLRVKD